MAAANLIERSNFSEQSESEWRWPNVIAVCTLLLIRTWELQLMQTKLISELFYNILAPIVSFVPNLANLHLRIAIVMSLKL